MELEFFRIAVVIFILESGRLTSILAREYLFTKMRKDMKGRWGMDREMAKAYFIIWMDESSKGFGLTIKYKVMVWKRDLISIRVIG